MEEGQISITVGHFSTYGVFIAAAVEPTDPQVPTDPKDPKNEGNGMGEGTQGEENVKDVDEKDLVDTIENKSDGDSKDASMGDSKKLPKTMYQVHYQTLAIKSTT